MTLSQLCELWNQFFFLPVSCAPLVVFRILIGILLLANALLLAPLIDDFFSADGMWPHEAWIQSRRPRRFSLLQFLPSSTTSFRAVWGVHVVASIGFLAGFQFHCCSVLVFLTLVSIHHRNMFILSSGDTLMRLFTFLAIFSDADAGLSVDRWLAEDDNWSFPNITPWPMRLMQLQMSVIYLRTVFWKLRGKLWWNGTAAWYPLWVDAYVRLRPPSWMINRWSIRIATWGTLASELALGSLIWIRDFRYPVLVSGILLHLVFDVIMNLQFFSWIMICGLLLFVVPEDMAAMLQSIAPE